MYEFLLVVAVIIGLLIVSLSALFANAVFVWGVGRMLDRRYPVVEVELPE